MATKKHNFVLDVIKHASVRHDLFDAQAFTDRSEPGSDLYEPIAEAAKKYSPAPELYASAFFALVRFNPQVEEEVSPGYELNRELIETLLETEEFRNVHNMIGGDPDLAAVAAHEASSKMLGSLPPEDRQAANDAAAAEQKANQEQQVADALEQAADQAAEEGNGKQAVNFTRQAEQHSNAAQQARDRAAAAAGKLAGNQQARQDKTRVAARAAMQQAQENIEAVRSTGELFAPGYDRSMGSGGNLGADKKKLMQMAKQVLAQPKMKRLIEIAGRFINIALGEYAKSISTASEVVGVTQGDDLAFVLDSELALLSTDRFKPFFYSKYSERNLDQYELEGKEKLGQGPYVILIDSSGSMDYADVPGQPTREVWAKAVTLGHLTVGRKQKRDVAIIHFSGPGQIKTYIYPKGEYTAESLWENMMLFFQGGTSFEKPLEEALTIIEGSRFNKADVTILSDGLSSIAPAVVEHWNRTRKERQVRVRSVLIGDNSGKKFLEAISDGVHSISDLAGDAPLLHDIYEV